ncbi:GDSL-type esterase/lipase family protein [Aquamicrobium soli]|uniref:GDSL-type esterase/lipase family protein n=1 Tax=Aquamicrobium soli TaxID=1811518 RepID=A0ABV7KGM7_9HYPH
MNLLFKSTSVLVACTVFFGAGVYTAADKANPMYRLARSIFLKTQDRDPTKTTYWRQKVDIYRHSRDRGDIAMVGDSITDHGEWTELFPGVDIVNRGISGDTAGGLLKRLDTVKARKVYLLIGINDILLGVPTTDLVTNYRSLIDAFHDRDLYVQSILHTAKNRSVNTLIASADKEIEALCASKPYCHYVDLNKRLAPDGYLRAEFTFDGLHLNGAGFDAWREAMIAADTSLPHVASGSPLPSAVAQMP